MAKVAVPGCLDSEAMEVGLRILHRASAFCGWPGGEKSASGFVSKEGG